MIIRHPIRPLAPGHTDSSAMLGAAVERWQLSLAIVWRTMRPTNRTIECLQTSYKANVDQLDRYRDYKKRGSSFRSLPRCRFVCQPNRGA